MRTFDNKVVIITGASAGIGQATAILFAEHGAKLAITGRNESNLEETKKSAIKAGLKDDDIVTIIAEFSDDSAPKHIIAETVAKFGQIDILINNAGSGLVPGHESCDVHQPLDDFDYLLKVNTRSVLAMCKEAYPYLKQSKGNIVNVSSTAAIRPFDQFAYYATSKAALDHLTRSMAVTYAKDGIRVNCINPGPVRTSIITRYGIPTSVLDKLETTYMADCIPLKRSGTSLEIAESIMFLASDRSTYTTGVSMIVDGGMVLYQPTPDYAAIMNETNIVRKESVTNW